VTHFVKIVGIGFFEMDENVAYGEVVAIGKEHEAVSGALLAEGAAKKGAKMLVLPVPF
jgi:hypothetical protein